MRQPSGLELVDPGTVPTGPNLDRETKLMSFWQAVIGEFVKGIRNNRRLIAAGTLGVLLGTVITLVHWQGWGSALPWAFLIAAIFNGLWFREIVSRERWQTLLDEPVAGGTGYKECRNGTGPSGENPSLQRVADGMRWTRSYVRFAATSSLGVWMGILIWLAGPEPLLEWESRLAAMAMAGSFYSGLWFIEVMSNERLSRLVSDSISIEAALRASFVSRNDELLRLLRAEAPGLLERHGWIEGEIARNSDYLNNLANSTSAQRD
jgi:hypothetical protein